MPDIPIKVVIAGGKGLVSSFLVSGLLRSTISTFDITVLSRSDIPDPEPSTIPPPHTLQYIKINYSDHSNLVSQFHNVHAVVSAVGQTQAVQVDEYLLRAALEAKVPRFFPNDFDCDRNHPHVKATASHIYAERYAFTEKLECLAEAERISWTVLMPSEFLDDDNAMKWLGFDISKREAILYDGGRHRATGCTIGFVGDCFAAVLGDAELASTTRNRRIPIAEVSYTGLELLSSLEEVMGEKWTVVEDVSTAESVRRAEEAEKDGDSLKAFLAHVLRLNYDGAGAANLVEGLQFLDGRIRRKSLREVVEYVVARKLSDHRSNKDNSEPETCNTNSDNNENRPMQGASEAV